MVNNTVDFDPGIGQFVEDLNSFVNGVYSKLMGFYSINQKRTSFRMFSNKIYENLENNIAFFQGCLLWAYYIKKQNQKSPKEISGNMFLCLSAEQAEEYDYLMQVNFIENYFDSYERDTEYYTGKKREIPAKWKRILELYKEFLELNNGFLKTKTTANLVLPEELSKKTIKEDINSLIKKSIEEKNLKILFDIEI